MSTLLHYNEPAMTASQLTQKLQQLFAAFPEVDIAAMGFPSNWQSEPLWAE